MAVEQELATFAASALGLVVGTSAFYAPMPEDAPDGSIAMVLFDAGPPEHDLGAGVTRLEFPQVQGSVRHAVYDTGRAQIDALVAALVAIVNQSVGGVGYRSVSVLSGPRLLKRDANLRWVFTVNFDVMKEPS